MSRLYDAKVRIDQLIQERNLDEFDVRGKLSLQSGVLLSFIKPETPDDPAKFEKLRRAVRELLQVEI